MKEAIIMVFGIVYAAQIFFLYLFLIAGGDDIKTKKVFFMWHIPLYLPVRFVIRGLIDGYNKLK